MQAAYGEQVEFLVVYIKEAHALDGSSPMGGGDNPIVEEPATLEERAEVATMCSTQLDMSPLRVLIDDMQNTAEEAYQGWPDRLYLVDVDGTIAYAGGRGPFDFKPNQLEDAIRVELELPPIEREEEEAERGRGRGRRERERP